MSPSTASALETDLASRSLDARYRAISYIASVGGPPIGAPAGATTKAPLRTQNESARQWLDARAHDADLLTGYLAFRQRWSPIFKD